MVEIRYRFLDLRPARLGIEAELLEAVSGVVRSGQYLLGPELQRFETDFARAVGASHAVGVGSGLDALVLVLRALELPPGTGVAVPAHTFVATWFAVTLAGLRPVPVDVHPDCLTMDPEHLAAVVDHGDVGGVLPVHLYGLPCRMDEIETIAGKAGIPVVYDAAQAHGARVDGATIGARGRAACWSFYPGKNLGALGDGGAVTTADAALAERVRRLRNYGSTVKYHHDDVGLNSRLDEIQSAALSVKLRHLDRWHEQRCRQAAIYREVLAAAGVRLQAAPDGVVSAHHLFPVFVADRDGVRRRLAERGVETLVHYPVPPHRQAPFAHLGVRMPVAEAACDLELSLPIGPHLSDDDVAEIAHLALEAIACR